MEKYRDKIINLLEKYIPKDEIIVTIPPEYEMGDFAVPCFSFAKSAKMSPKNYAEELKKNIPYVDYIEKIEVTGGYLNFFINKELLIKETLNQIQCDKDTYGSSMSGKGKKALIEHTSINPNASPHLGRSRNALLGDTLVRLMKFEGYDVETHYFVNDIGKQIAMLLLGAKKIKDVSFENLLDIYVEINNKIKDDPTLEKEVFALLFALENGDEETIKSFRKLVQICIDGQTKIFEKLGITYDFFDYESDYVISGNKINDILSKFKAVGRLIEDEAGRLILNLEGYNIPVKSPVLVLTRADKTSLYPLRDIAYTIDKVASNSDKNIIVLGEDQKAYFQQIKAALDILGYTAPEVAHYSFVLLSDGKMSTRNGTVVLLEDFMKEAVSKARIEMQKRHDEIDEEIADSVAYAAVKYAILKAANNKNITFAWNSAMTFEGDSGPYLQYNYARINSIIKKIKNEIPVYNVSYNLLHEKIEFELVRDMAMFKTIVQRSIKELSPHLIANYVSSLTKKFSSFYHDFSILNANTADLRNVRIVLIKCIQQVMKNCFYILGIDAIEFM